MILHPLQEGATRVPQETHHNLEIHHSQETHPVPP